MLTYLGICFVCFFPTYLKCLCSNFFVGLDSLKDVYAKEVELRQPQLHWDSLMKFTYVNALYLHTYHHLHEPYHCRTAIVEPDLILKTEHCKVWMFCVKLFVVITTLLCGVCLCCNDNITYVGCVVLFQTPIVWHVLSCIWDDSMVIVSQFQHQYFSPTYLQLTLNKHVRCFTDQAKIILRQLDFFMKVYATMLLQIVCIEKEQCYSTGCLTVQATIIVFSDGCSTRLNSNFFCHKTCARTSCYTHSSNLNRWLRKISQT